MTTTPIDKPKYTHARKLRKSGRSIKGIAKLLSISPSTASLWCRDIELTSQQRESLATRANTKRDRHLRFLARKKRSETLRKKSNLFKESIARISPLNNQELFLVGLALYWAEGFKSTKESRIGFCNSDPKMIKLFLIWLQRCFNIKNTDITLRTEFNISHKDRTEIICIYWSKITGIPVGQFEKPFYHRSAWLKSYDHPEQYFGVLRIRVRKSSELLLKILGYIHGLKQAPLLKKQLPPAEVIG